MENKTPKRRKSNDQKILQSRQNGELGELLLKAWQIPPEPEESADENLTPHFFHPYPGRFHPHLAHTLIQHEVTLKKRHLLDPFMGSGTALTVGMLDGLKVTGLDLNPISWLIVFEKTRRRSQEEADAVLAVCQSLRKQIEDAAKGKPAKFDRPHMDWLRGHYAPHLFIEMLLWIEAIDHSIAEVYQALDNSKTTATKELVQSIESTLRSVFSSLVTKFSNRLSDSSEAKKQTSFPKGAVSRWMENKITELLQQQVAFQEKVPRRSPPAEIHQGDILKWRGPKVHSVDVILTSPPYPGTYDYAEHHLLRLRWLNWREDAFVNQELTPRRRTSNRGWQDLYDRIFKKLAKWSSADCDLFLVVGDWLEKDRPVDGLKYFQTLPDSLWTLKNSSSVEREVFFKPHQKLFAKNGKWEHLLHFVKKVGE